LEDGAVGGGVGEKNVVWLVGEVAEDGVDSLYPEEGKIRISRGMEGIFPRIRRRDGRSAYVGSVGDQHEVVEVRFDEVGHSLTAIGKEGEESSASGRHDAATISLNSLDDDVPLARNINSRRTLPSDESIRALFNLIGKLPAVLHDGLRD
jgi:hypothetical protein